MGGGALSAVAEFTNQPGSWTLQRESEKRTYVCHTLYGTHLEHSVVRDVYVCFWDSDLPIVLLLPVVSSGYSEAIASD